MRKHPLIALIAFTFLAVSIFIGAAGASNFNSVPVRATSHLSNGEHKSSAAPNRDLRWLAAAARERAAASAQLAAQITSERNSPAWQAHAADTAAIHDVARPAKVQLPSIWRRAAERSAALAYEAALKQQQAQAAQAALKQQQAQAAQAALQQQQAQAAQAALRQQQLHAEQAARAARAANSRRAAQAAKATYAAKLAKTAKTAKTAKPSTSAAVTTSRAPAASSAVELGGVWLSLRLCESGNNYAENTGNGYYGAYQFALSTWWGLGYGGLPSQAAPAVQDRAAERLQAAAGWGQWPACSAELGL